jgi:electron transfer flavoprotein beta subunit
MKILVCIKMSLEQGELSRFDSYALEQAILIKKDLKDLHSSQIDVVTMGSEDAIKMIRRSLGMGADNGILIVNDGPGPVTPFFTASALQIVAAQKKYDLILTGIMSEDAMAGQTGPMLAEKLNIPCVTGVVKTKPVNGKRTILVEQEVENGYRICFDIQMPCVLAIQPGINTPGYPSLSKLLAAEEKQIVSFPLDRLFNKSVKEKEIFISYETPEKTREGKVLQGTLNDKVDQLNAFLVQKDLL